jgi:hypothetical protein
MGKRLRKLLGRQTSGERRQEIAVQRGDLTDADMDVALRMRDRGWSWAGIETHFREEGRQFTNLPRAAGFYLHARFPWTSTPSEAIGVLVNGLGPIGSPT